MGIRPRKLIGWGIKIKGSELNESVVDNLRYDKNISYSGLIDYIIEKDLMKLEREYRELDKDRFSQLDKNNKIFKYIDVVGEEYDDEKEFEDIEFNLIFYPNILSPLALYKNPDGKDDVDEYSSGDDAFVYAELEHFFPESMDTLKTVSYNFKMPPFPSDYSIIEKKDFDNLSDFVRLNDKYITQDVKKCLLNIDTKYLNVFAQSAGFENVEEVKEAYCFAPPEDVFAFAQYSQIFNNEGDPFYLKPTVVYHWT